jgi:ribosomal protein S12
VRDCDSVRGIAIQKGGCVRSSAIQNRRLNDSVRAIVRVRVRGKSLILMDCVYA